MRDKFYRNILYTNLTTTIMKHANYNKLNNFIYNIGTIINQEGQEVVFIQIDDSEIYALFPHISEAFCTGFYDLDDMIGESNTYTEYTPIFQHGECDCAYNFGHTGITPIKETQLDRFKKFFESQGFEAKKYVNSDDGGEWWILEIFYKGDLKSTLVFDCENEELV